MMSMSDAVQAANHPSHPHMIKDSISSSSSQRSSRCSEMIPRNFILVFLFISSIIFTIAYLQKPLSNITKSGLMAAMKLLDDSIINNKVTTTTVELKTIPVIPPIFEDCIPVNNITNYFQCPKLKNYYYYLNALNTTYNVNCYWVKNNLAYSFWKCDETDVYENKHKLTHIAECAVIFSGGTLLLRKAGKEIDSHTHVFRMNYPVLKGYEEFVGNKTTFHSATFTFTPEQFGPAARIFNDAEKYPGLFDEHNATILTFPDPKRFDINGFHKNENRMKELNLRWILVDQHLPNMCNRELHGRCTSGFFMLIYALQMCNDVDLYGFSDDKCLPIHYFKDDFDPRNLHLLKKECTKILYKEATIHNIQKEHNAIKQMAMDWDNLHIVNYV
eukprot:484240_1